MPNDTALATQIERAYLASKRCIVAASMFRVAFCADADRLLPWEFDAIASNSDRATAVKINADLTSMSELVQASTAAFDECRDPLALLDTMFREMDRAVADAKASLSDDVRIQILLATGGNQVPESCEVSTFHELSAAWATFGKLSARATIDFWNGIDDAIQAEATHNDDLKSKWLRAEALADHFKKGFFKEGLGNERILRRKLENEFLQTRKHLASTSNQLVTTSQPLDSAPREETNHCPIQIEPDGRTVIVNQKRIRLGSAQHKVLTAVTVHFPTRLSKDDLVKHSGAGDAVKVFKRLAEKKEFQGILTPPASGQYAAGYGIG